MTPFEKAVCDPSNHAMKGATRENLEAHGIAWPPPRGWRKALRARVLARFEDAEHRRATVVEAMVYGALGEAA